MARKSNRTIQDIISPLPNISTWLWGHHFWLHGNKKTLSENDALVELINRKDFNAADILDCKLPKINALLDQEQGTMPWDVDRDGWKESSIIISVPFLPDSPPSRPSEGIPYAVPGFRHRSICAEIRKTLMTDPAAKRFVFDPFYLEFTDPLHPGKTERAYGELFNSDIFIEEDLRLQNSPPVEGCDAPRVIMACAFWSDATQLAQFAHLKAWPGYLYFGNQSKYERARPSSNAAHHVAYFPVLPDDFGDFLKTHVGVKTVTPALLTHCRRELFQGGINLLLDDEFIEAYHHGMLVDCIDGVRRRVYPRIFVYSGDYPEKVLLATIRDKGLCPCPRCLVKFDEIPALGTEQDRKIREERARKDNLARKELVEQARVLIYKNGYVPNSVRVDELLKSQSLVPTRNVFSEKLKWNPAGPGDVRFDFHKILPVDPLHEIEIGVWKNVWIHIIRIITIHNRAALLELNQRFRMVPAFSTIRPFHENMSDMTRIAARDYEDILQCVIPCFEGLLDSPHNESIMSLLYTMATWHALAKMRMHIDSSLKLLDDGTTALGIRLRHFAGSTKEFVPDENENDEEPLLMQLEPDDAQPAESGSSGSKGAGGFHMRTIKTHFLGDYVQSIKTLGTTDSTSTQIGELEHRRVKARYARTNKRNVEAQLVDIDIRESRLTLMAHELREKGVDVPQLGRHTSSAREGPADVDMSPEDRYRIGTSDRHPVSLQQLQEDHPEDPALTNFVVDLKAHIHAHLCPDEAETSRAEWGRIAIRDGRIYHHETARINYTTYDVQREQDVVHPKASRNAVLVYAPDEEGPSPWVYAWVLGVYHARVHVLPSSEEQRVPFLWVRWLDRVDEPHGLASNRLEHVFLRPSANTDAFGFVDPEHVIRACHLIPRFARGRTATPERLSIGDPAGGAWAQYSVNQ
ncbi:hypothetical protein BC834DRAFT_838237 [Gloeopeniophorella convolvens]|nr:hypothetical protein BC834DRAFT_838237 [Gloeopeniophorella convolvens]